MQVYLYAKSGHSIGLDATRRCAAVGAFLQEFDPILCTSDFRAGAYAKEHLGIKKYVSVDVLSNLPNIMQRGDILIYDSDEASDFMEKHMRDFCSSLYKIGSDIPKNIINTTLFTPQNNPQNNKAFFFGDDDYNNALLNLCHNSKQHDLTLLMGHYFFLGNETKLAPFFSLILEEEEYIQTIQNTKYLLSGSINACLESLYCGNSPVFYKRCDKSYLDIELIEQLDIPIISSASLDEIVKEFESVITDYPLLNDFQWADLTFMTKEVQDIFNKYDTLVRK
jgi:hypothetical protein